MSFPGPISVTQVRPTSPQDLPFRLYERVTAQVLKVTETQAVMEINGYPIVAKLTSKDQAAALLSRRSADFIITQLSTEQITLKFINTSGVEGSKTFHAEARNLAAELSSSIGLEGNEAEIQIIQAALQEHLPVTRELVTQLMDAVNRAGIEFSTGIRLALKLKAAGLPVTTDSLQLAQQFRELHLSGALADLMNELNNTFEQPGIGTLLGEQIQKFLEQFGSIIPDPSKGEENLKESIKELLRFLGKPYERLLLEGEETGGQKDDSLTLLDLAQIAKGLKEKGLSTAAERIDHFLEQIRQNQFFNIKPGEVPAKGQWGEVNFFVNWSGGNEYHTADARIRVSYRHEDWSSVIDPEFSNLILQVELEDQKEVIFSLALCQKKVSAEISSRHEDVVQLFKESLPDFCDILNDLGYQITRAEVQLESRVSGVKRDLSDREFSGEGNLDIEV